MPAANRLTVHGRVQGVWYRNWTVNAAQDLGLTGWVRNRDDGTVEIHAEREEEGLDRIFTEAGFEWRKAGCSMCLAMNPDKLKGRELSASSSNRNFKGRQGSPLGRTLLMSPVMVAAAAIAGEVVDAREMLGD